jgi:hypothetical protein
MNTVVQSKPRFMEGGNVVTAIFGPVMFALSLYFYSDLVRKIAPLEIKIEDVYGYTFNLFAIELGALLALFALFACKPTPFLERIKNTATFAAIVSNTNITLVAACVTLFATFILGLLRFEPNSIITSHTVIFVGWCWLALSTTLIYVRTVRLILTALA